MKDGGDGVKRYESAHQEKDGFGGSGLRGGPGRDVGPVNVLDSLLVPVQDKDHGATGPEHEQET